MTEPRKYLSRMLMFMAVVIAIVAAVYETIIAVFTANIAINGVIVGVLLVGVIFVFRQVLNLKPEIEWVETYKRSENSSSAVPRAPRLLAPMAALMGDDHGRIKLSAMSMRSLLDSLAARLSEGRETSRYLISLLVFLGLLGTFWGLLDTIGSIGDTIKSLTVGAEDITTMFDDLKRGLETPLSGMATAFSSSLFGLAGSLILGFLDLQAGHAQNHFYNDLEEWLSSFSKLSSASNINVDGEGGASASAYTSAILEQSADSLDKLQRIMARSEETRKTTDGAMIELSEHLASLADQMKSNQKLMQGLAESQLHTQKVLKDLVENNARTAKASGGGLDEASREHLRNLDVHMKRLLDQHSTSDLADDLRKEFKLLTRTLSMMMDQKNSSNTDAS